MGLWIILQDIVLLLGASLLLGGLFSRYGQSPLLGYLIAGMLLGGPGSIHAVRSQTEIEAIAELGVALLLFSLGLEFSLSRLKKLGSRPLYGGALQVVLTLLIAAFGALAAGFAFRESLAFGAMVSLSSTAVVLRMLMERAELEKPHGRNSLAVLLVQDMAVVPLALLVTLLAGGGGVVDVILRVAKLLLLSGLLVAGLYFLTKLAERALGTLTMLRNRELTILFAVVMGLGSAWAAHAAGISPALGAFIAGMFLGSSAFATQIRADVSSLRVILLTLFFGAAGMVADPIWILQHLHIVAATAVALTVGKLAITWGIFQALGQSTRVAAATGLCLAQIGEFAFVLGSIGKSNGVISADMYALVVSVTIVSFAASAFLVPLAPTFGSKVASLFSKIAFSEPNLASPNHTPDLVFIGFGPAGAIAAEPFVDCGHDVLVLDLNHEGVRRAKKLGFRADVGDATQDDVLQHAGLQQAKAIVISIPDPQAAISILEQTRRLAPQAHLLVRSRYRIHSEEFIAAGAHAVIGDEEEVGKGLAHHLQSHLSGDEAAKSAVNQADTR